MWRGGSGRAWQRSGLAAVETPYEKQVLAIARACSEFGLTVEEVEAIPVHRYNSCHGNSYAVWNKQSLADARARKQAAVRAQEAERAQAAEKQLEQQHGGAEGLAAHRAAQKAAAARQADWEKSEHLRARIAALQPGCKAPRALPDFVHSKKDAKAHYYLTDTDLKKLTDHSSGATLLAAAKKKHGALGFEQKRQAEVDAEARIEREPLQAQLAAIEARYPEFKVSEAELAGRAAAKLEAEASAAEAAAAEATAVAKSKRQKAQAARAKATRLAEQEKPAAVATPAAAPSTSNAAGKRKADAIEVDAAEVTPVPLAPIFAGRS